MKFQTSLPCRTKCGREQEDDWALFALALSPASGRHSPSPIETWSLAGASAIIEREREKQCDEYFLLCQGSLPLSWRAGNPRALEFGISYSGSHMNSCGFPMWERPRCRDCGVRTTDLTSAPSHTRVVQPPRPHHIATCRNGKKRCRATAVQTGVKPLRTLKGVHQRRHAPIPWRRFHARFAFRSQLEPFRASPNRKTGGGWFIRRPFLIELLLTHLSPDCR